MKKSILGGLLILFFWHPCQLVAAESEPAYEEILVYVRVQNVGGFEINALYTYENNRLLLPVADLFQYLQISNEYSTHYDTIKGFLIDEQKRYLVDHPNQVIRLDGASIILKDGELVKTESGLYLYTGVFGKTFGLYCTFQFRSLSVEIKTDLELPAIRELRLQQMRRNIERLKGEVVVDTIISRQYHLFRAGMIDWGLSSTQLNGKNSDTRASVGIGVELLGGETNLFLNYSTREGLKEQNQQYYWRWANNNTRLVKQIRVGKILPGSISSIYSPVLGISASNTPTRFRRSFGEYTLSDFTEPGWTVELYINNVIVDYVTADASGFFSFDVPLVYGSSQMLLKFYGPYGEERIREQYINVPYNFLPKGEIEYSVSSGLVQDGEQSIYSRASLNYGISRKFTVGGGLEYLSSINQGSDIPFLSASLSPFNNLLISGEYAHGVRAKTLLSYRLPSNLMFELDYANYEKGQQAIRFNYLEERKATIAIPLNFSKFRGFTRLSYKQNVYELLNYNTVDATLSTYLGGVNANISTFANWVDKHTPFIYSNLVLGMRLGKGFTIRPQAQIDISNSSLISFKAELEKRILRTGYFSVAYEENVRLNYRSFDFTLRWDLNFAQANLGSRIAKESVMTTQGVRGSIALGSGNQYIHTDNRSNVGRGGITVMPFLDVNHNGSRDDNEPMVEGLSLRINGGRILQAQDDTLARIVELEPYATYLLEVDETHLENISWQVKNKIMSIYVDPNQFKRVQIPVFPMGEANGTVYISEDRGNRGIGRILVNFYKSDGTYVDHAMSEPDGYINFLGLPPGDYMAAVDNDQLIRLGMQSEPLKIDFKIQTLSYGDIVDGLDFILTRQNQQESEIKKGGTNLMKSDSILPPQELIKPGDNQFDINTSADNIKPGTTYYYIQTGAFRTLPAAEAHVKTTEGASSIKASIIMEDGLYKVRFGKYNILQQAIESRNTIRAIGVEAFIGKHKEE